jgi:hypothetical protein
MKAKLLITTSPLLSQRRMLMVNAGKSKSSLTTIIAIVVPIAGSAVIFSIGCYFLRRRTKKNYNTLLAENGKQKRKALVDLHL